MAAGAGKCSKIRYIVRLRQMVRRWRQKAAASRLQSVPTDVPPGHVAVSVGSSRRRFIVRATHLNHPIFRRLLVQAEEEYGFGPQWGPLSLPCDELLFEHILSLLARSDSDSSSLLNLEDLQKHCHFGLSESWPLIHPKSVW